MVEHWGAVNSTIDGNWTSDNEWTDGMPVNMSGNARFTYKMWSTTYSAQWIVEFFDDNTNDTGDLWQICIDANNSNETAPQTNDFKIEIEGHTTLKVYQGTGSGWTEVTPATGEIIWNNLISASPWNSTPHWILEIVDSNKEAAVVLFGQPPNGMRVAAYDANTGMWASWPPSGSADVPAEWGVIATYDMNPYPEGFSIVAVVLLSSVAVAVGFYFVRKRLKTESYSSAKTGINML